MSKYLVTTTRNRSFQRDMLDEHYAFLGDLRADGLLDLAGPFADGSGGAYLLNASNIDEARSIATRDPMHLLGAATVTVYEWDAR
ncbi:YciI family protein [Noviherbaspirillum pedocola]|uniref:YCII-related domain-containing protein n=1 Tax=Noviherbaspirillum pedocola TaxID=2801341 RepID=A0A934W8K4_9BURK|nr:YciI family protein [Noviherbaspirillum pedocola]MBK4737680.1 hypothetical protein [Noviherbaspirillum pedocola]